MLVSQESPKKCISPEHSPRPFTIMFFLADDTIEIREQYPLNCGRRVVTSASKRFQCTGSRRARFTGRLWGKNVSCFALFCLSKEQEAHAPSKWTLLATGHSFPLQLNVPYVTARSAGSLAGTTSRSSSDGERCRWAPTRSRDLRRKRERRTSSSFEREVQLTTLV